MAELVGEIWQKVQKVVKHGGFQRRLHKRIELLVYVKHYGDGQNQCNGEYIRPDKLADYIPIKQVYRSFFPECRH